MACASAAVALWRSEGALALLSVASAALSAMLFGRGSGASGICAIAASASVLACAAASVTVASHDALASSGAVSRDGWIYLSAVIRGVPLAPIALLSLFAASARFGARFNWALVSGFVWLIGTGMISLGNAFVYVMQQADIDSGKIVNSGIYVGLMVCMLMCLAAGAALGVALRRKGLMITPAGLEARRDG
jgi:hypothetical protein